MTLDDLIADIEERENYAFGEREANAIRSIARVITLLKETHTLIPNEPTEAILDALFGKCSCPLNHWPPRDGPPCDRCELGNDDVKRYKAMIAAQGDNDE